jgi:hypothetical protein
MHFVISDKALVMLNIVENLLVGHYGKQNIVSFETLKHQQLWKNIRSIKGPHACISFVPRKPNYFICL